MNLQILLLRIFPVSIVKVLGESMHPTYKKDQRLITVHKLFTRFCIGDVVVFYETARKIILIKRISKIQKDAFFVEGDNKKQSTDSNQFGWVDKKAILAKVIYPKTRYNSKQ